MRTNSARTTAVNCSGLTASHKPVGVSRLVFPPVLVYVEHLPQIDGLGGLFPCTALSFLPVSALSGSSGREACGLRTGDSWADLDSFLQSYWWLFPAQPPFTWGSFQSVRCFISLPLQLPPVPEWHGPKLQTKLILFCQMAAVNRAPSFEIVALPYGRPF